MPRVSPQVEVPTDLTPTQLSRISRGLTVQLKPTQIGCGIHKLQLSQGKAKKLMSAKAKGKGMRITLSQQEVSGSGFWKDAGSALKKGWQAYQKHVKPVVGPTIRSALTTGIKTGLPAAAIAIGVPQAAPALSVLADKYAGAAVNYVGNKTGGFGLVSGRGGGRPTQFQLRSDHSTLMGRMHPSQWPALHPADHSVVSGGSFRPA